jgi:hypothetical protein
VKLRPRVLCLLGLFVAIACTAVGPTPSASPQLTGRARTPSPTPLDVSTLNYPNTARALVDALNEARLDDALALIDEHFAFGGDCDYQNRRLWSISDLDSARNWLQVRIADHDQIQIVRFVDMPTREHALGVEIVRSSDSIRAAYTAGVVRPRVPMVMHFSLDGRQIQQLAFAWTTPVAQFQDCG